MDECVCIHIVQGRIISGVNYELYRGIWLISRILYARTNDLTATMTNFTFSHRSR